MRKLFSSLVACATAAVCLGAASTGAAQEYPNKPIRIIVAASPGQTSDLIARILAPDLTKFIGQPVVVEYKPGAGFLIGWEYVAKDAPADGYTIVPITMSNLASLPLLVKDLRFDPLRDLPPVIGIGEAKLVMAISAQAPFKTFREMVPYAKANPGKLNYGGPNALVRLVTEAVLSETGIRVVHVPYPTAAPYIQGITAGDIHMGFFSEAQIVSMGDKIRVVGVTGERRWPKHPEVPTFTELGLPQIKGLTFSLNVRAGTPKPVTDRLYAATARALQQPEVKAGFEKIGYDLLSDISQETAAKRLADEAKLLREIATKAGIKPE